MRLPSLRSRRPLLARGRRLRLHPARRTPRPRRRCASRGEGAPAGVHLLSSLVGCGTPGRPRRLGGRIDRPTAPPRSTEADGAESRVASLARRDPAETSPPSSATSNRDRTPSAFSATWSTPRTPRSGFTGERWRGTSSTTTWCARAIQRLAARPRADGRRRDPVGSPSPPARRPALPRPRVGRGRRRLRALLLRLGGRCRPRPRARGQARDRRRQDHRRLLRLPSRAGVPPGRAPCGRSPVAAPPSGGRRHRLPGQSVVVRTPSGRRRLQPVHGPRREPRTARQGLLPRERRPHPRPAGELGIRTDGVAANDPGSPAPRVRAGAHRRRRLLVVRHDRRLVRRPGHRGRHRARRRHRGPGPRPPPTRRRRDRAGR